MESIKGRTLMQWNTAGFANVSDLTTYVFYVQHNPTLHCWALTLSLTKGNYCFQFLSVEVP
jgi:hypothetical protein